MRESASERALIRRAHLAKRERMPPRKRVLTAAVDAGEAATCAETPPIAVVLGSGHAQATPSTVVLAKGMHASHVVAVSDEVREAYQKASPLTLSAPIRFTVGRGASAREMRTLAHKAWQYVCQHFSDVRLDGRAGSYQQPTQDYGGLRSMMDIRPQLEPGQQTGLRFVGTPSYDKKGMSRQREPKSHKAYRELIHAVLQSTSGVLCDFQLISPGVGFFYGVDTGCLKAPQASPPPCCMSFQMAIA